MISILVEIEYGNSTREGRPFGPITGHILLFSC